MFFDKLDDIFPLRLVFIGEKMKKKIGLLAACALCTSAIAINQPIEKSKVTVKFSGSALFSGYFGNQKEKGTTSLIKYDASKSDVYASIADKYLLDHKQHEMFAVDNSKVKLDAKSDFGRMVGTLTVVFTGDRSSKSSIREIYGTLKWDQIGSVILGNTKGIEDRFVFCPSDIAAGSGGTDGNFFRFINMTSGIWVGPSIVGDTGYATKVVVSSARIKGFKVGVSYVPNTQHVGEKDLSVAESSYSSPQAFDRNSFAPGINYLYQTTGFSLGLSFVTLLGKTCTEKPSVFLERFNTKAYDFGCSVTIGAFQFGAEYIRMGKSQAFKRAVRIVAPVIRSADGELTSEFKAYDPHRAGNYNSLNLGVGYTVGSAKFSVTHFRGQKKTGFVSENGKVRHAAARAWVFSSEYQAVPGFVPYFEAGRFDMKNCDWRYNATYRIGAAKRGGSSLDKTAVAPNKSTCFIVGLKLNF